MVRWLVLEKGTKSKSFVDLAWRAQQTSVLCLMDIRATRREIVNRRQAGAFKLPVSPHVRPLVRKQMRKL